ncbi:cGMP-inhibited 3',5'-cyclic phosphodiesterase A [Mytilus galloprovincialis]|uniref:Phosphodiesterase n=1 Tax=Mytilus galloprovincialis TaxID=29158 RepID=A0A8B6DUI0_MYTGA|nr:cGMP-inhibited 3',5'-cyclic phosphodiesterase A [Mytilus galloprovincialis]
MAHRGSISARRGSKNDANKEEDEPENNGYIQILVKPLEQGNFSLILNWLGLSNYSSNQLGAVYSLGFVITSLLLYHVLRCDIGSLFQRFCGVLVPVFTVICAYYWLSLYLRKTWNTTSVYLLFSSCFLGETVAQIILGTLSDSQNASSFVTQPLIVFIVLLSICISSVFSSLETQHSAAVISLVSFTRFLACSTLTDIPQCLRPYVAYICGLTGVIISKYMETILKPPISNFMTSEGKIPVIKRRRSSTSTSHAFAPHKNTRRTSLPALIPKSQSSSASFESALLGEAHGLITDMLADTTLPSHVVGRLRTISNLLKPPENHSSFHKPRVSPLVSLTESAHYGSDTEESPYTGERPSTLPKKIRKSLPPSLIRRMSTSTWTTTTSATGMPTLEMEPCRIRSSSFRHHRDVSPGASPGGSRSNSPSPSSPTVVLTIPKSRSFSLATTPTPSGSIHSKKLARKSMAPSVSQDSNVSSKHSSLLCKTDADSQDSEGDGSNFMKDLQHTSVRTRANITSDYESNDSPSSSDHSDNVVTNEDFVIGSPPNKSLFSTSIHEDSTLVQKQREIKESLLTQKCSDISAEDADNEDETETDISEKCKAIKLDSDKLDNNVELPWDVTRLESCEILSIQNLNDWDFPIFDLAKLYPDSLLSKVGYKLFLEVGLFETFRIPLPQFLHYFHSLEKGYRSKPYHNRVHATDVLHGVYYLTTQPIPGFTQVHNSDMFNRNGSSSESESELLYRSNLTHRANSFAADDSYGIMGGNFPALELMALYTAAAMHDYDHPGRTNAFLVATSAPQAVMYNDRSVLENHHAAAAWRLLLSDPKCLFLSALEPAEFKRFRFLVIELILATDLKRHFEILAEFNAKANDDEAPGINWTVETDRLLVMQMVIKIADINGPAKTWKLHHDWTTRISEEFYEQGDEEARLGMPISPYMDRKIPQLAKLQETFINHLVAPLCNALVTAGLLPGTWVDEPDSDGDVSGHSDTEICDITGEDNEDDNEEDHETEAINHPKIKRKPRKVNCLLTKNMKENHEFWVARIKEEELQKSASEIKSEKQVCKSFFQVYF